MIYIAGYKFTFSAHTSNTSNSIQERMALSKTSNKTKSIFDERFVIGDVYKLALIKKIKVGNALKYQYLFNNTSKNTQDIEVLFNDTGAGDRYVAALSNTTSAYKAEKSKIANVLKTATY